MTFNKKRKTFSFVEPCLDFWDGNRGLRKLALQRHQLVRDSEGKSIIAPSLVNLRYNYPLLKGYTKHMAETGIILTNRMSYLKPPIKAFYELMEVDCSHEGAKTVIYATAFSVKQMLSLVKRKWNRWELPRATGLVSKWLRMLYVAILHFIYF